MLAVGLIERKDHPMITDDSAQLIEVLSSSYKKARADREDREKHETELKETAANRWQNSKFLFIRSGVAKVVSAIKASGIDCAHDVPDLKQRMEIEQWEKAIVTIGERSKARGFIEIILSYDETSGAMVTQLYPAQRNGKNGTVRIPVDLISEEAVQSAILFAWKNSDIQP